jgi:hypothetical protein
VPIDDQLPLWLKLNRSWKLHELEALWLEVALVRLQAPLVNVPA